MLGNGHGNAGGVNFLEGVAAQKAGADIAGNGYHGYTIHIGGSDTGDEIGGAGAAGGQNNAGFPRSRA